MGDYYTTLVAILATYGISTLLSEYNGARDVFVYLRTKMSVFRCTVCLSVWVAVVIALLQGMSFTEYLAVVGGVISLDRILNL